VIGRRVICFLSAVLSCSSLPAAADTVQATTLTLARELPISIASHQMDQLAPYFADDVRMKLNVPQGTVIEGKRMVFLAFQYNPLRSEPQIAAVILAPKAIVVVQNIPTDKDLDRLDTGPRVDTFHLNDEGKIVLIESILGSRVVRQSGRN
jgi:hypothetical protein